VGAHAERDGEEASASCQRLDRGRVEVVEVIVRDDHHVDGRQRLEGEWWRVEAA
jgi:hypothetical protein